MNPIIAVLLICFSGSTGLVVFWRSRFTPASLPSDLTMVDNSKEKFGFEISNMFNTGDQGLTHELAVIGKPSSVMVYEQFLGIAVGIVTATLFGVLILSDSLLLAFLLIVLLATLGWALPKVKVKEQAEEAKTSMRQALAIYQELAATAVAGGQSVQSALRNAATYGDGEAWARLRGAAANSMTSEKTFSSEIQKLADLYQIPELDNLAGLIQVADEGGTSKTTLNDLARQQSRKFAQQTLDESEEKTSKLILPTGLIFLSFVLLLGFAVMDGLSQIDL